jgi:predicted nucleic acid-binding protein
MTSTKRVVINASPLITLCRSQLHVLLPQLFDAVYVPDAVWQEVVNGGKDDAAIASGSIVVVGEVNCDTVAGGMSISEHVTFVRSHFPQAGF